MPLGDIKVSAGGDADRARTEYPHLILSLMLSIILVYLLMAVLFDNLIHPLTIQLSLPMAMIGAVLALVWMDQQLSIISITGFIMLGGIVQKNAILLVDYTNTLRGARLQPGRGDQRGGSHPPPADPDDHAGDDLRDAAGRAGSRPRQRGARPLATTLSAAW